MAMVSLVVMEPGSDWPGHVADSADLVAFSAGGELLLHRTQEKVGDVHRDQPSIRTAVLACSPAADDDLGGCRLQVAPTLLRAVLGATFGRLVLTVHESAPSHLKEALLSLTNALREESRGTKTTISLKFIETRGCPARRGN